jgi:hypothetical protein
MKKKTIEFGSNEPEAERQKKMDEIFDPNFKIKELNISTKDVPPDLIPDGIKSMMAYVYKNMEEMNSAEYRYKISYPVDSFLKGIHFDFHAWYPGAIAPDFRDRLKNLLIKCRIIKD